MGEYSGPNKVRPFIQYLKARIKRRHEQVVFRAYVSEGVRLAANNVANAFGGSTLSCSFASLLEGPKHETRTAEEIISHMKGKLREIGEV